MNNSAGAGVTRVLVVEDNADLAYGLQTNLEIEGYLSRVAGDGESALRACAEFEPQLIILDLMIPGRNGYEVLRTLREQGSQVPVIILSAQTEETARIRGFRMGADDYITKPFSVLELLARVEAVLRRAGARAPATASRPPTLRFGSIEVDLATHRVLRDGRELELPPKVFDLLVALVQRDGAVVTRNDLLREVWGHKHEVTTRTVDHHVFELRRGIEADPAHPRHILTVRKTGYRFQR